MNKLITKIVGAALGLTMAVGVGVVAGANFENSMEAVPVRAAEGDTHDMGVTFSSLLNNGASIDDVNIEAQSYTVEKVTLNVDVFNILSKAHIRRLGHECKFCKRAKHHEKKIRRAGQGTYI